MQSRSWRIVDVGAPSSTHWVVHRLELYGRVAVDVGRGKVMCRGRLDGTSAVALYSGSLAADSSGSDPGSVFSSGAESESSWHSQQRDQPGEAWIGAEFPTPVLVRCLQIYQGENESFHAKQIGLERLQEQNGVPGRWEGVTSWGDATNSTEALISEEWLRLPVGLEWDIIPERNTQATSSTTTALPPSGASTLAPEEPRPAAAAAPEAWVWVLMVVLVLAVNAACLACLWRWARGSGRPQQRVLPYQEREAATKPPPQSSGGGNTASDEACVKAPRLHSRTPPEPPAVDPSPLHLDPPGRSSSASTTDLRSRTASSAGTSSTAASHPDLRCQPASSAGTSSTATSRGPPNDDLFGPHYSYPFAAPPPPSPPLRHSYQITAPPSPAGPSPPLRHSYHGTASPSLGTPSPPLRRTYHEVKAPPSPAGPSPPLRHSKG